MTRTEWSLVTLRCADGLELDALWVVPPQAAVTLVHIHGKGGNFYHNGFVREMYRAGPERGVAVLGVNTRGNGAIVEAYRSGTVTYVGAAVERLSESWLDVAAALEFASLRTPRVVLQGHSYGCDKLIRWAGRGQVHDLVLISPANSVALQHRYLGGAARTPPAPGGAAGTGEIHLAPRRSYGIRTDRADYWIPVDAATLEASLDGDDLRTFDWAHAPVPLPNSALVLLGGRDDLQLGAVQRMAGFCLGLLPQARIVVEPEADHQFNGCETALCSRVLDWVLGDDSW